MTEQSPRSASSIAYVLCILALLACVAVLGWQVKSLRNAPRFRVAGADPRGLERLFSEPLESAGGSRASLARLKSRYVVLFVFTTADCSACLPELESLARIEQSRKDIQVIGILAHGNRDEARQTQDSFAFKFPVLIDPDGAAVASLQLPKTPWKLVVDIPAHEVIYQDQPSVTAEEREAFFQRVTRLGYF